MENVRRKNKKIIVDKLKKSVYNITAFKTVIRSRGQGEPVNEESPSVLETGCRRNPGGGDFKESATENYRLAIGKDEKVR